jgi:hypothetical protein
MGTISPVVGENPFVVRCTTGTIRTKVKVGVDRAMRKSGTTGFLVTASDVLA